MDGVPKLQLLKAVGEQFCGSAFIIGTVEHANMVGSGEAGWRMVRGRVVETGR